ncbi:unnamed protein product [Cylindrotheca closterium]|uniref:Protein kinase domain-containing protein n=1 Tax=Cylindrotheca closterium TaxID=2856 RepID=A0AAD2CWJ5_9STRA|nr:unnamed protein product [Cylindrotheca closterium]
MSVDAMIMAPSLQLHIPMELQIYSEADPDTKITDLPTFEESSIRKICKLGSGCHHDVYLVSTQSRQQLALKCLSQSTVPNQDLSADLTNDLIMEAQILAGLDHENIIKVRGVSCNPIESGTAGSRYFFLMDVLSDSLFDRVQRWSKDESCFNGIKSFILGKRTRKLDPKKMMSRMETVAIGVAQGMAYLHNKGVVLQDLKPANIGFDMETGQARIFDFGMARHSLDLSMNKTAEICGTPRYMAPEIMKGETPTKASDVYSFGCVLYTLCSLKVPFRSFAAKENELEEFKAMVIAGERPSLKCIPCPLVRSLIQDCWAQDPLDRPTFNEIVEERLPDIRTECNNTKQKKLIKRIDSGSLNDSIHVSFRSDSGITISVKSSL